ncbi:MAG: hypothetical protein ACPHGZ_05470 [Schleiferiaceae bacterium]
MKGCQSLAKEIYWSMDCDQFNIDHIELRTGIDIPKITRNYCELSPTHRKVSFELHKSGKDKAQYAATYFDYSGDHLFSASGTRKDHQWFATLDTTTNELIFIIHYLP